MGVPAAGDLVFHPQHGPGRVTGHTGTHVSVRFDSGAAHSFEHADRQDGQAPRFVSRDEHEGALGRSAATILGAQLESDGSPAAAAYRTSLHHVPEPLLRVLKSSGTRIKLTAEPVGGARPDLAHVRPRGYPEGKTWKDSAGMYDPAARQAVVGNTVGHGSVDITLHETSHALDHALGYPSRQPVFTAAYHVAATALGDDLSPYFGSGQGTEQGARSEFLAETMAAWMKHEDDTPADRADAMLAAVAPAASADAVRKYQRAADRFPNSRLARGRAEQTATRNAAAAAAMARLAALYQNQVTEAAGKAGR